VTPGSVRLKMSIASCAEFCSSLCAWLTAGKDRLIGGNGHVHISGNIGVQIYTSQKKRIRERDRLHSVSCV